MFMGDCKVHPVDLAGHVATMQKQRYEYNYRKISTILKSY